MSDPLEFFVRHYQPHARKLWASDSVAGMAGSYQPEALHGTNWSLAKGDVHTLWARWFVASLINPSQYADPKPGQHVKLFRDIQTLIEKRFTNVTALQKTGLIEVLVDLANAEIQSRSRTRRMSYDAVTRRDLLDRAGSPERCWICGYEFTQTAIDRFIDSSCTSSIPLPAYIDFLRPSGAFEWELKIEVDHMTPAVSGGDNAENLRLACGWCNRMKSNHTNLYDVGSQTSTFRHPTLGVLDLAQNFWVVRVLAISKSCQHIPSPPCTASTATDQMYIAPVYDGAMTPPNMACYCKIHDPLRNHRFITKGDYEKGLLKT